MENHHFSWENMGKLTISMAYRWFFLGPSWSHGCYARQDAQRVRTENLELRSRLAHAIYCSTEAQHLGVVSRGLGMARVAMFFDICLNQKRVKKMWI